MEINSTPATTTSVGLRYGLLTGLICVIISFGLFVANMAESPMRFVTYAVLIGGMVLAMQHFKAHNQGFMSFGQGMGIGTILSAVMGGLSAVFTFIYVKVIDPEIIGKMLEKARADMEARGGATDEQIDQGMAMVGKFMNAPVMAGMALLFSIIAGAIFALVVSAIIKNTKPEFE